MKTNTFFKTLSAAALAIVLAACGGQKDSAPAASAASSADNGAEEKRNRLRYNCRRLRRYGKRPNPTSFGEKRL